MKKIFRRATSFLITLVLCFSVSVAPVFAASSVTTICNRKTVDLSGYKKYKGNKATTYMKGTLYWTGSLTAKFSGTTGGKYAGAKKADKITHVDQVSASGIGSLSVGYHTGNAEISGSEVNFSYSAKKTTSITNQVSYLIQKGLTFSATVTCNTQYRWGNTNYRIVCGDNG